VNFNTRLLLQGEEQFETDLENFRSIECIALLLVRQNSTAAQD
jgi:hypothetical protein